jgi:hypothetical protein
VFHQLVLEVDAGAIQDQRETAMLIEEKLREDQIEDMHRVVVTARKNFGDVFLHRGNGPVRNGGWEWVEQAFREKAFPVRMIEREDVNVIAEFGKDVSGVSAFAVFSERE